MAAFGATADVGFLIWQRGPVVANVAVTGFDDSDRSEAIERLARQMDRRIQRVLAGEILPTPVTPTAAPPSTPALTGATGEAAALQEGFDLTAMLPTAQDVAEGLAVVGEGFVVDAGVSAAYQREFVGEEQRVAAGTLPIIQLNARVDLYDTPIESIALLGVLTSLGDDSLRSLMEQSVGEGTVLAPEDVVVSPLGIPVIGDALGGIRIDVMSSTVEREVYLLFTTRGRIGAQLLVQGAPGQLELTEVIRLAQLIDDRIMANSP